MSPEVQARHIALYVNRYSLDVGDAGLAAIERLVAAGNGDGARAHSSSGGFASTTDVST
jgi:predicted solute-binding protein